MAKSLGPLLTTSAHLKNKLWQYTPLAVAPFLNKETEKWGSELRRVTTLFINLGFKESELDRQFSKQMISAIQTAFAAVQRVVYDYQGTINKFLVDDKGSTLVAVWGLAPLTHENDPIRGMLAALSICAALQKQRRAACVGVTSGIAFCGVVGHSGTRREFSVLGDVVNLSARLMAFVGKSKRGTGVCCDKATKVATRGLMQFESEGKHLMKGKSVPTEIFRPATKRVLSSRSIATYASIAAAVGGHDGGGGHGGGGGGSKDLSAAELATAAAASWNDFRLRGGIPSHPVRGAHSTHANVHQAQELRGAELAISEPRFVWFWTGPVSVATGASRCLQLAPPKRWPQREEVVAQTSVHDWK